MGSRTRQLEEQDGELLKFHERIGDLWLKAENLKEQLEIERADRKSIEEEYWDKVEALTELRSQLATEHTDRQQLQADLDRTLAELAELKENPPPATQQPPTQQPTIDLEEQIPQIINFLKELLPPDTKWPKRVMPKLREHLESKEG